MTDPTKTTCDGCGKECRVTVQHGVRIGKRVVVWRECLDCLRKADDLAVESCRVAESAGVA